VVAAQEARIALGALPLRPARVLRAGTGLVSPGVLDVTRQSRREDEEVFGPLLQVVRVRDFEAGLAECSDTRYGLAAGLVGGDEAHYARFLRSVRAGVVNWNTQLTGASGAAPFGGAGLSGNHRPSAFLAADYCSRAVASMETPSAVAPATLPPGLGD
jgi:succinylglutamic semialdehyde dehydrogenase